MLRKTWLVIITLGAVLMCTPAFSEIELGRHEVSGQFFGQFVANTTHDGVKQDASYSGGVLGDYRFFFSERHGVEANYSWARSTQRYNLTASQTGIKSDQHEVSGAYVFRIPMRRLTAFFEGGGAALIFRPKNFEAASTQTRPAALYGGGVDVNLTSRLFLRAQYRGFVYKSPTYDLIDSDAARFTHMAQPSAGLGFRF